MGATAVRGLNVGPRRHTTHDPGMGTTFTFARVLDDSTHFGVGCRCVDDAACVAEDCEDWRDYGICEHTQEQVWCVHRSIEASFTGSTAELALKAMGLEPSPDGYGLSGVADAYDFAIRARRAAAENTLDGDRAMASRLARLSRLGVAAWRQQAKVGWS